MNPVGSEAARAERQFFIEHGYIGPCPLLDAGEVETLERLFRTEFERNDWSPLKAGRNRHLDLNAVASLCRRDAIRECAISLLGPDLLLWRTQIFGQNTERALPWHQDTYSNLLDSPATNISFHVAISPATEHNCVAIIPGSHRTDPRKIGLAPKEALTPYGNIRFKQTAKRIPEKKMLLQRGEYFVFHPKMIHRTCCTRDGTQVRFAIALRFTTPNVRVRPEAFTELSSSSHNPVLVAGADAYRLNQLGRWPE
jgi:non-haem Fe2+, alpha-ketoglutarate-dependent halogenase